jgi:hypothetical protein
MVCEAQPQKTKADLLIYQTKTAPLPNRSVTILLAEKLGLSSFGKGATFSRAAKTLKNQLAL